MVKYKRDSKGRFIKGTPQPNGFGKGKQKIPWNKDKHTGLVPSTAFGGENPSYIQGKGKENSNYIHGQRCNDAHYPYSPEFMKNRVYIISRDKVCKMCGKEGDHVHHINLDKEDNSLNNLILLCKSCHSSIHGKYIEKKMIPIIKELING